MAAREGESSQGPSAMPDSVRKQREVEADVFHSYNIFYSSSSEYQNAMLEIQRDNPIEYLTGSLRQLPASFCCLDASRPWLCYWSVHALALLGESIDDHLEYNTIDFLSRFQVREVIPDSGKPS